jgi:hypothetical protein
MTLAPETGEVSWVCMGLRRVLILAEVSSLLSKSQDSSSGLEVVGLEVKSRGVSPAVSGCTDSKNDPASGIHAAALWCLAPWDLLPRGLDQSATCPYAAVSHPIGSGPHNPLRQTRRLPVLYEVMAYDKGIGCQLIVGEIRN